MGFKIRVLGTHAPVRNGPAQKWAYRAEAIDDADPHQAPTWACTHTHETPQLAQACGLAWLAMQLTEEQPTG